MVYAEETTISERLVIAIGNQHGMKAKIASACGVQPQAITNWINRGTIDYKHLPTVSDITGANLRWLMTGKGAPWPDNVFIDKVMRALEKASPESVHRIVSFAEFETQEASKNLKP